jgi:hypothetical protein
LPIELGALIDGARVTNRISQDDKVKLMVGTLTRIYGWSPHCGQSQA